MSILPLLELAVRVVFLNCRQVMCPREEDKFTLSAEMSEASILPLLDFAIKPDLAVMFWQLICPREMDRLAVSAEASDKLIFPLLT